MASTTLHSTPGKRTSKTTAGKVAEARKQLSLEQLEKIKPTGVGKDGKSKPHSAARKKTRAVADKIASSNDLTPLEIIVEAMLKYRQRGLTDKSVECAVKAAPYIHPRLNAVEWKGGGKDGALQIEVIQRTIVDPSQPGSNGADEA